MHEAIGVILEEDNLEMYDISRHGGMHRMEATVPPRSERYVKLEDDC